MPKIQRLEPLEKKTYMNDNNFPLLISHFSEYDKRRKRSFSYTKDIKSAVEWLKWKIELGDGSEMTMCKENIIKRIIEAFPDLFPTEDIIIVNPQ